MCVCVCVCVCVCECVRKGGGAANLHMVGLAMRHSGLILCGVANGSSPGLSYVVETNKVKVPFHWPCKLTNERVTHAYTFLGSSSSSEPCYCP